MKANDGLVAVQTIRNMEIAFLTTDDEYSFDDRFENPFSVVVSNQHYGHMQLENKSNDKDMIVAPQIAVMTSYAAQNHGMKKSAIVLANTANDYNDAGCVQGSRGGMIRGDRENDVRFIPITIRELLLQGAGKEGYTTIYPHLQTLGTRTGVRTGNYLDPYYTKYDPELQEFIAHFERPAKTIGVIVFVDGEIVAIDKFPSFTYTAQVWDLLVRDCYGSIAIESIQSGKEHNTESFKDFASHISNEGFGTVDYLADVLNAVREARDSRLKSRLDEIVGLEFTERLEHDNSPGLYDSLIIENEGYIGQIIMTADYNHLVSLIKRDKFSPEHVRNVARSVAEYRELASKQREFAL
jgi:hypothetical protein